MKNIFLGIIGFFLVLALVFNFGSYYNYSYDGSVYGVDFSTPTDINASMIQTSFDTVYSFGNSISSVFEELFYTLSSNFREGVDLKDVDGDIEFADYFNRLIEEAKIYIDTLNWWDRLFIAPARLDAALALVRDTSYKWGYVTNAYSYNLDIEEFSKYLGWSSDEISAIHEFCIENERTHTYKGVLYDFR